MASLSVHMIPALADNYMYLIRDPETGTVGIVDPAEPDPVAEALEDRGWRLDYILNTHHHADHTGGNGALKTRYGCPVIGPRADADRIPHLDIAVGQDDAVAFGDLTVRVLDTPGHTRGHIAFWFPEGGALFCGDTLFALGCGRLFEGTPAQMWESLGKLRALPPETMVYCGHEYTLSNARFAVTVDPENGDLRTRADEIRALRDQGSPTIPSTIGLECRTNPFLRADQPSVCQALGLPNDDPVAVFAEIRRRKDTF